MEFPLIRQQILEHNEYYRQMVMNSLREDGVLIPDRMARWLTPRKMEKFSSGELSESDAVAIANERIEAEYDKELGKELRRITFLEDDAIKIPKTVSITIEYRRTRALAFAFVDNEHFEGSAGGWGYDKESAAVAEALNKHNGVIRMLCELKEKGLARGENPKGVTAFTDNRYVICYGCGYLPIPYLEGGVGVECHMKAFGLYGFECRYGQSKNFTSILMTR